MMDDKVKLAKATNALKMAYRKHHLSDDSIGWTQLSDVLCDALCDLLGDTGFENWLGCAKREAGRY
jgi:hypothetical protein